MYLQKTDNLRYLEFFLKDSDIHKSSFWKHFINEKKFDFYNIQESSGFGTFTKRKKHLLILHFIFQIIIFGFRFFKFKEYNDYKKICLSQNRFIDVDVIRNIFTINLLKKYDLIKQKICVIGDGKSNFVSGLLKLKNDNLKIISINLPEILIHDYIILTKSKIISDDQIKVIREEKDLKENNKKLFLLDPSRAKFLKNKNINLFVNIASMQEMKHKSVKEYFHIIRNNKSFFYCCNRKSLTHFDGTTQEFFNYPWGNCSIIFSEICEWHKKYYDSNFPFIKKYEGTLFHRLVKYN